MGARKLCKWKRKRIEKQLGELRNELREPRFVCRKCARAAHEQKRLCKPVPLDPG